MGDPASRFAAFIAELKRRRVFRVAIVYAGVAFVLGEVANNFFPALNIPDWAVSLVVALLVMGFPIAVGLAWAFDITEKGVVKTPPKEQAAGATRVPHIVIGNKTLAVVAAVAVAVAVWSYLSKGDQPGPINAIAVLPLENLMNDPDQDYFVDGMHEALIADLSKIGALRVISRTSVMQYKELRKPLPEIALELGVNAVVEGSVLRAGNRVRITAQLIGVEPERHLWANSYERDLRDILALHSEVARDIAGEIRAAITPAEDQSLRRKRPVDPDAFDAYIRGRHYWNKRSPKHLYKAIEYFQQAIELDPGCALGYHGLADVYLILPILAGVPAEEYFTRAKAAALKALELNPGLGEAYATLAAVMDLRGEPWAEVEKYFQRAIELSPSYATAHQWYGLGFLQRGRLDEYTKETWRAYELDPLSLIIRSNVADTYYHSRQYDRMISEYQKLLDLDSTFPSAKTGLGLGYLMKGELEEALQYIQEGVELSDSSLSSLLRLGCAYAKTGEFDQALEILSNVQDWSLLDRDTLILLLQLYTCVGAINDVFTILEKAYVDEPHPDLLQYYTIDPLFDPVTQDPRFSALVEKAAARAREK